MDRLVIPGTAQDYYTVKENVDGGIKFKADRAKIRLLVDMMNNRLHNALNNGEDHYRISLDDNDVMREFFEGSPDDAYIEVLNTFTEEMEAIASATNDRTNKILAEADRIENENNNIGQVIGGIVGVIAFIFFMIAIMK